MSLFLSKIAPHLRSNPLKRALHVSTTCKNIFSIQSAQEFDEKVMKNKDPVVVDFFATWCGPCKMLTPRIETVITEAGGVSLAKVDIDEHNDLAFEFDVSSVPVLVGMRNGVEVARMVGLQDKDKIKKFVEIIAKSK